MSTKTIQSKDRERKDIFSRLQDSLGFQKEGEISLVELHEKILEKATELICFKEDYIYIFYAIKCASELMQEHKDVYLNLKGDNIVAEVHGASYKILVGSEGIKIILHDSITSEWAEETCIVDGLKPFVYDVECYIKYLNIALSKDDVNSLKNDLKIINKSISDIPIKQLGNKDSILKILKSIPQITNDTGWMDWVYAPFFTYAFECICRSVLSGEYAMDDNFSHRVRALAQKIRNSTLIKNTGDSQTENALEESWLYYLSRCVVTLSQMLDEYNLFCIQTDAQVDKEPASILRKAEEYYDRHAYVNRLYDFMSGLGFLSVNPMLVHFFQSFLEMAKIDQNFYFSTANFASLMYLQELLQDDGILGDKKRDSDKKEEKRGKGLVQVWEKVEKDSKIYEVYDFNGIKNVLKLAKLKNSILLRKMWVGCYEELKDLTYVGQDKVLIFDPRKCREKEVGEEYHTELLLRDKLFEEKEDIVQDLLILTKSLIDESYFNEKNENFEKYEKEYIKAMWSDEESALKSTRCYYENIMMSQTSHTSLDIRHYNSKVIEMSREAVYYTANYRIWIKHNKYNFDEEVSFPQIHKFLLFLQNRYTEGQVCYDIEMLEEYARWCIEFLNIVSKKAPEPDSNRPSQIEEALLLLETINGLLDGLVVNIEKGNYCLPFASKFRGCFFKYKYGFDNAVLERIFIKKLSEIDENKRSETKGYAQEDFESFIAAGTSEKVWEHEENRNDIVFIASSFVLPFNLERLKIIKTKFKRETHKLRNEIHAEYFNRLREYVKEDSLKQLEENRRSVVQILGIFAAFLALTTVALGASTANHSNLPFMSIMIGFTTCIAMFVWVLFWITRRNIRNSLEHQNKKDNITKNEIYEEVNSVVKSNIEDIKITEKKIEKDLFDIKIMIKNECEKLNGKDNAEIKKLKEKIDAQISETEQEQKNKLQEINNRIPNEIAQKIEKYRKKQNITETLRLWGPSIFISIMLMVIAVLILVKSRPVEKPELKEVKIDITSNNTVDGKKEDDTQNKAPYDLIFPHAYNYSTAPLIGMPQSLQSAEE